MFRILPDRARALLNRGDKQPLLGGDGEAQLDDAESNGLNRPRPPQPMTIQERRLWFEQQNKVTSGLRQDDIWNRWIDQWVANSSDMTKMLFRIRHHHGHPELPSLREDIDASMWLMNEWFNSLSAYQYTQWELRLEIRPKPLEIKGKEPPAGPSHAQTQGETPSSSPGSIFETKDDAIVDQPTAATPGTSLELSPPNHTLAVATTSAKPKREKPTFVDGPLSTSPDKIDVESLKILTKSVQHPDPPLAGPSSPPEGAVGPEPLSKARAKAPSTPPKTVSPRPIPDLGRQNFWHALDWPPAMVTVAQALIETEAQIATTWRVIENLTEPYGKKDPFYEEVMPPEGCSPLHRRIRPRYEARNQISLAVKELLDELRAETPHFAAALGDQKFLEKFRAYEKVMKKIEEEKERLARQWWKWPWGSKVSDEGEEGEEGVDGPSDEDFGSNGEPVMSGALPCLETVVDDRSGEPDSEEQQAVADLRNLYLAEAKKPRGSNMGIRVRQRELTRRAMELRFALQNLYAQPTTVQSRPDAVQLADDARRILRELDIDWVTNACGGLKKHTKRRKRDWTMGQWKRDGGPSGPDKAELLDQGQDKGKGKAPMPIDIGASATGSTAAAGSKPQAVAGVLNGEENEGRDADEDEENRDADEDEVFSSTSDEDEDESSFEEVVIEEASPPPRWQSWVNSRMPGLHRGEGEGQGMRKTKQKDKGKGKAIANDPGNDVTHAQGAVGDDITAKETVSTQTWGPTWLRTPWKRNNSQEIEARPASEDSPAADPGEGSSGAAAAQEAVPRRRMSSQKMKQWLGRKRGDRASLGLAADTEAERVAEAIEDDNHQADDEGENETAVEDVDDGRPRDGEGTGAQDESPAPPEPKHRSSLLESVSQRLALPRQWSPKKRADSSCETTAEGTAATTAAGTADTTVEATAQNSGENSGEEGAAEGTGGAGSQSKAKKSSWVSVSLKKRR